jgi:hypothetical protein
MRCAADARNREVELSRDVPWPSRRAPAHPSPAPTDAPRARAASYDTITIGVKSFAGSNGRLG